MSALQEKTTSSEELSQELNLFLTLATGEIKVSMKEASQVVQQLTKTFMEMVLEVHKIKVAAEQLQGNGKDQAFKKEILDTCNNYLDKVEAGTVGFQFYDKMTQRLSHTSGNIKQLIALTEKPEQLLDKQSWQTLKTNIEKSYNMEEDRALFQALMQGDSIQNAITMASEVHKQKQNSDNIELF